MLVQRASPPQVSPLTLALLLLGLTFAVILVVQAALLARYGFEPLWLVEFFPGIAALYVIAGLVAWWRRPANRIGPLLLLGGLAVAVGGLANIEAPLPIALGTVFATAILGIVIHLLHAFPSGRVPDRFGRATVVAAYVVTLVVSAPQYLFHPEIETIVRIAPNEQVFEAARLVGRWSYVGVTVLTIVTLLRRLRAAPARQRPGLAVVYASGIIAALGPMLAVTLFKAMGLDPLQIVTVQLAFLALVPPILGIAMLTGEFRRVGGVESLVGIADTEASSPEVLERALASALGDPTVRLTLDDGHAEPGPTRGRVEVRRGDHVAASIDYDAIHLPDPSAVSSAAALVGVILERDQLAEALRLHQAELLRSRERVVAASDVERRRIARDLHDGLQGKLILLAMHARGLDPSGGLVREIDATIDDLRALIGGVMPPVLLERGLHTALSELADRAPMPVDLDLSPEAATSLAPAVETTVYFVAAEALTNALKHAEPTRLGISLGRTDDVIRLEVRDDGRGGARLGSGSGLIGLQDRVAALGGELLVDSPAGAGTRVIAGVPCGS